MFAIINDLGLLKWPYQGDSLRSKLLILHTLLTFSGPLLGANDGPGRADSVSLIKFNIETEIRKASKGKPTKVPVESLLLYAGLVP